MSDTNSSGWPFGEDISGEGLDFDAIFSGGGPAGSVNPFDIPAAQPAVPAAPPVQPKTADVKEGAPATASENAVQPAPPPAKPPKELPAETANPIEDAFARQEEKAAQTAAKSLFEKAPVFSYGSAREDIADPAQTFEELRIAKSDDFPELSEGKRVSWSVEYGRVTKAVTDPKGTTIRSVKEEIEKSKAFLDGLKKSKDKNPDCLVKPRVTAQSKGVASYKGVFRTLEEAQASEKPICLIPGGDGRVYELRKTEMGEFIAPKDKVIDFQQIRAGFTPALKSEAKRS